VYCEYNDDDDDDYDYDAGAGDNADTDIDVEPSVSNQRVDIPSPHRRVRRAIVSTACAYVSEM
jgi:hypothetical protein